jgi:hypothetical protein
MRRVADLDGTEAVELLLVTIGDKAKGIEENQEEPGHRARLRRKAMLVATEVRAAFWARARRRHRR